MFSLASRVLNGTARRAYSQSKSVRDSPSSSNKDPSVNMNTAIGLSNTCVKPTNEPVGPGASHQGIYKVPEYFCFNRFTFSEAEIELAKYRCPQPSATKK